MKAAGTLPNSRDIFASFCFVLLFSIKELKFLPCQDPPRRTPWFANRPHMAGYPSNMIGHHTEKRTKRASRLGRRAELAEGRKCNKLKSGLELEIPRSS